MGRYLYCQAPGCGVYLGSLGGDSCGLCGWCAPEESESEPEYGAGDDEQGAAT